MRKGVLVVVVLLLAVVLTACGGSLAPKSPTPPNPGTYGDVAVTAKREESASVFAPILNWLFPKAHAVEESTTKVRFIIWDPVTDVKVVKDVDMVAGMASASMRVPARLGYRVATAEWDEETQRIVGWGIEPKVDILTGASVMLNVGIKSFSAGPSAKPTVNVWQDRAMGGDDVMGTVTIPYDLKIGGFGLVSVTNEPICQWAAGMTGRVITDTVPPARIDWRIPVPILQTNESVTCEYEAVVEVLDARPQGFGAENMPPISIVPDETIVVTFDPPEIIIK